MTIRIPTGPTGAEASNWNEQAQQPSTTWVRSSYNAYLTIQKCSYLWNIVKAGQALAEPGHFVRVGFQAFAVPLAERTGSETAKKCALVASEALGAVCTPVSWGLGKVCQFVGGKVAGQVIHHLDIQNPELRDLVDCASSELSTIAAGQISQKVEQKLEEMRNNKPVQPIARDIKPPKISNKTETPSKQRITDLLQKSGRLPSESALKGTLQN
ncbi:MAG: hypothetical protein ACREHG_09845, partial [Candidatus Saccharimonadales bacterium]